VYNVSVAELLLDFKPCKVCEVMMVQLKDNSNWVCQLEKNHSIYQFVLHISQGHNSPFASPIKELKIK
jgi:hypothetical protein